jgi:hypothetical protein
MKMSAFDGILQRNQAVQYIGVDKDSLQFSPHFPHIVKRIFLELLKHSCVDVKTAFILRFFDHPD